MLVIKQEIKLSDFNTWSGATDTIKYLTDDEIEVIEQHLIAMFPSGLTETDLNDFLWFDRDFIAELLGYNDFDEIINR